jgi:hypothetical protein
MTYGSSPVRGVDHVVVEAGDEHALFDLLTGTLGLPTAWPMAQWGLVHEAGVGLGNCNIGCNHPLDLNSDPRATVRAIAFEPAGTIAEVVEELGRRGLSPSAPMWSGPIAVPEQEAFEPWRRGWTTVLVIGGPRDPLPFVCAYEHDTAARRHDDKARLDAVHGGPLGITGLRAVIVHADDLHQEAEAWTALVGSPLGDRPTAFEMMNGPEVRIESGTGPPALLLGVRSMRTALDALDSMGFGHEERSDHVRLEPAALMGLDIRLAPEL